MLITFPLVALTLNSVIQANFSREVRSTIATEVGKIPGAQLVDITTESEDSTLHLQVTVRASRQITYIETVTLQSAIAEKLQRTVSLQLIVVPMIKLDPLVPPTPTHTSLPGATSTFTPSPTMIFTPIPSATLKPTPTATSTSTDTATPTSTFTPTPVLAYIANTGGLGIYLRDKPNGKIIGAFQKVPQCRSFIPVNSKEILSGSKCAICSIELAGFQCSSWSSNRKMFETEDPGSTEVRHTADIS